MEQKVLIISNKNSNLINSIVYLLEQEKIEYLKSNTLENFSEEISNVIYVDLKNNDVYNQLKHLNVPILVISDEKKVLKDTNSIISYIITNLFNDDTIYTNVQLEYLFKKGLYSVLNSNILNILTNLDNINGYVIDITECQSTPVNWKFKFNSIAETYNWLKVKNKSGNKDFIKKEINFYNSTKVYNDSSKEINYLIDKIMVIKSGINLLDIYLCTKEELENLKSNYFFKALLTHISDTYSMYFIDKDEFSTKEPELLQEFMDGIIIYEDCVYKDTYNDEYSLGYVDCNSEIIMKYNNNFDYVLKKYGKKLNSGGDIDEI